MTPPPPPTVLKGHLPRALCGPQGARSADPPLRCPRRNAPRGPAALAAGAHPDPCRTRKLSRPAPKVLQGRPCGRLGRRRPPGRVARAGGGEARTGRLGGGGPERVPPPFVCGRPPRLREEERPPAPSGAGGLFAFGASCAGFAGLSAAFCMSPIRVARFWRVGVLKGASGSMPLAFDVLAPSSLHSLCLCRALFGGQTSERGL